MSFIMCCLPFGILNSLKEKKKWKTCLPEEINHPETLLKEKQILITSAFNCPLD